MSLYAANLRQAYKALIIALCFVSFTLISRAETSADAPTSTDTTTKKEECSERPFTTPAEREKVRQEDVECYILRTAEAVRDSGDAQALQSLDLGGFDPSMFSEAILNILRALGQSPSRDSGTQTSQPTAPTTTTEPSAPAATATPIDLQQLDLAIRNYHDGLGPAAYFQDQLDRLRAIAGIDEPATEEEADTTNELSVADTEPAAASAEEPVPAFDRSQIRPVDTPERTRLQEAVIGAFTRPTLDEPTSPLAPNLYTDVRTLLRSGNLITPDPQPTVPGAAEPPPASERVLPISGAYAPLQNLILSLSNGLLSLFEELLRN